MDRRPLNEEQSARVAHLLPGKPSDRGGIVADNRLLVEAVLWITRTDNP